MAIGKSHSNATCSCNQRMNVLVILVLNELLDDLMFWLNLQHLQYQAQELRRAPVATKSAANTLQIDSLVDHRLSVEGKTVLLPVERVVDFHAHDFVDEILGIGAVHIALLYNNR